MDILEILEKNGNVKEWHCINNGVESVYSVGDIFLMWCETDAEAQEKSFDDCNNMPTETKELFYQIVPEAYQKGWEKITYFESHKMQMVRECLENKDMLSLYDVVNSVVDNNYINAVEQWDLGLRGKVEKSKITVKPFFLADHYGFEKTNIRYGKSYHLECPSLSWLDAFVLIDLQELIKNKSLSLKVCKHCFRVFIVKAKNQRYCPICQAANISEKLKHATPTRKLYNRIRSRLYNREYFNKKGLAVIYTLNNFINDSFAFRTSHTPAEYLEWLQEMDIKTK